MFVWVRICGCMRVRSILGLALLAFCSQRIAVVDAVRWEAHGNPQYFTPAFLASCGILALSQSLDELLPQLLANLDKPIPFVSDGGMHAG
ncbi:hypothetical protein GQ53DRAFT_754828 [Thozetella sp. PMI_491]|nr:hypothetical protein GQ53DRAFT_754828 [Thozetella sp. PMI_491]